MTDITKILEQAFADSGGVIGKAYLLDAKAEIERLRGLLREPLDSKCQFPDWFIKRVREALGHE